MDPNTLIADMHRSREQLRALLLAGQPGYEDVDVFPRSRTMRFLLDPGRRGIATTALGALMSFAFGRSRRRHRHRRRQGILGALAGLFRGHR